MVWWKDRNLKPQYICQICKTPFYAAPSLIKREGGKYCSYQCSGMAQRGENNVNWKEKSKDKCEYCGKDFEYQSCWDRKGRRKYCSVECRREGVKHSRGNCLFCGKSLINKPAHQKKYCSFLCRSAYWKKTGIKKTASAIVQCEICGKAFERCNSEIKNGHGRFCSMRCVGLWRSKINLLNHRVGSRSHGGKREDLGNLYFRSAWEANWARYLNIIVKTGLITKWEFEPDTFEFPVKRGSKFYTPDFKLFDPDGTVEYHEIKGYMDQKSKTKIKRMGIYHPNISLTVIDSIKYRSMAKKFRKTILNWEE